MVLLSNLLAVFNLLGIPFPVPVLNVLLGIPVKFPVLNVLGIPIPVKVLNVPIPVPVLNIMDTGGLSVV